MPCKKSLRLYDMSNHRAAMASAATLMEKRFNVIFSTNHTVLLCNCEDVNQASKNYRHLFKTCPSKKCQKREFDQDWKKYFPYLVIDADFQDVDGLIFGYETTLWEKWTFLQKPLILALWHVANLGKCNKEKSQQLFEQLRQLALNSSVNHVIGSNTLYHFEYIRHYTGLNPVFLTITLISAIDGLTWSQKRNEFLFNTHYNFHPPKTKRIKFVKQGNLLLNYELSDLTEYAGAVVAPYSITNGKSVEHYAMNIPMFAPTVEFAKTMINDRTATYDLYCNRMNNSMHPPKHQDSPYEFDPNVRIDTDGDRVEKDVKFWISFTEIYRWPCIEYFESWEHLYDLLETADRQRMSACMKQANKWRIFEELQNWCWTTKYLQDNDISA